MKGCPIKSGDDRFHVGRVPAAEASMKGRPIKSGDGRPARHHHRAVHASIKGRPIKSGDLTTGTAELITDEVPR